MGTLTLSALGGNFLSYVSSQSPVVENTGVPTSYSFVNSYISEQQKIYAATRQDTAYHYDAGAAIIEFDTNPLLQYKKINSVILHYKLESVVSSDREGDPYRVLAYSASAKEYIAGYITTKELYELTLANFQSVGSLQSGIENDVTNALYRQLSATRQVNITDLYKSNFVGAKSKFLIATGQSDEYQNTWVSSMNCARTTQYSSFENRSIILANTYLEVDYDDATQPAPSPTYPIGVTLMENTPINFSWVFNSETLATQASADIQYRAKGGSTWTTIASASSNPMYTLSAGLSQGTYEWRVRVTNIINETSNYSDTFEFDVIGRPSAPIITSVDNKCLTTIEWNASNQDACELMLYQGDKLLIHETLATTITSYKPQMFLKGNYSIKLRYKTSADIWSDFAEYAFIINGTEPNAGTLHVIPLETSIRLEWTAPEGVNSVIIRREKGIETVLAESMNTNEYEDKTIKGGVVYNYILRTWTNGYTDTPEIKASCNYAGAIISKENEEMHLETSDDTFIPHSGVIGRDYALDKFEGRAYPMLETGQAREHRLSKRFYVTSEELEKLVAITEDLKIFYRDNHNNAFRAAVTKLDYQNYMQSGYIIQIELTRLADEEVKINV